MMKTKLIVAAALAFSALAGSAYAQTNWLEIADSAMVAPFNVSADDVEDMNVVNAAGEEIGEVEEVIGTAANAPTALVMDFDDDSGYGDRDDLIVPLASFAMGTGGLTLDVDPASTASLQKWDD